MIIYRLITISFNLIKTECKNSKNLQNKYHKKLIIALIRELGSLPGSGAAFLFLVSIEFQFWGYPQAEEVSLASCSALHIPNYLSCIQWFVKSIRRIIAHFWVFWFWWHFRQRNREIFVLQEFFLRFLFRYLAL